MRHVVEAGLLVHHELDGLERASRKDLSIVCAVRELQPLGWAGKNDRVIAYDVAGANSMDQNSFAGLFACSRDALCQPLRGPTRRVLLRAMMTFHDLNIVTRP